MDQKAARARRVDLPASVDDESSLAGSDYASSFAVDVPHAAANTAEHWASRTLEGAPRALRWFVLFGWRVVLRLRLAPLGAAGSIMGWRVGATTPDTITLAVSSSLVAAHKLLTVEENRVVMTTYVRYERALGRVLWSVIVPIHHLVEPLLLTHAARSRLDGEATVHDEG
jgi:hypothetical protein